MSNLPSGLARDSGDTSIPSTVVKGLNVESSSLTFGVAGGSEEALGGHQGLMKNYGGSDSIVSSIPARIMGFLLCISCSKAQQP